MARASVALPRTFWFSLCRLASSVMTELYNILRRGAGVLIWCRARSASDA
jgi:hypothetical protein